MRSVTPPSLLVWSARRTRRRPWSAPWLVCHRAGPAANWPYRVLHPGAARLLAHRPNIGGVRSRLRQWSIGNPPSDLHPSGSAVRVLCAAERFVDGVSELGHRGELQVVGPLLGRIGRGSPAGAVVTAVDPDRRQAFPLGWDVVVEQALSDVQEVGAGPPRGRSAPGRGHGGGSRRAYRRRRPRRSVINRRE
jgi:hypothetical protein